MTDRSIEELPSHLRATLPTVSISGTDGLFEYLASRMTTPRAPAPRLANAELVVYGTVTRSQVIAFAANEDANAANDAVPSFANVVEVQPIATWSGETHARDTPVVATWPGPQVDDGTVAGLPAVGLLGLREPATGSPIVATWPAPQVDDGTVAGLPAVGSIGLLCLCKLAAGRAAAVPGALATSPAIPFEPVLLPAELAAVLDAHGEPGRGVALEVGVALAILGRRTPDLAAMVLRVRAGADDRETLLVRAALFALGERDAATAGYDAMTGDEAVLRSFGIVVLAKAGKRLGMSGPAITEPLPWSES